MVVMVKMNFMLNCRTCIYLENREERGWQYEKKSVYDMSAGVYADNEYDTGSGTGSR